MKPIHSKSPAFIINKDVVSKSFFIAAALLLPLTGGHAATTYDWAGSSISAWSSSSNWSPSGVPTAADSINQTSSSGGLRIDGNDQITNYTYNPTGSFTIYGSAATGTTTLTVSGTLKTAAGAGVLIIRNSTGALNLSVGNLVLSATETRLGDLSSASNVPISSVTVSGTTTISGSSLLQLNVTNTANLGYVLFSGTGGVINLNAAGANTSRTVNVGLISGSGSNSIISAARVSTSSNVTATLQITGASGTASYAGQLMDNSMAGTGTGNTLTLIKSGAGTQILSGSNSYSGTTTVNAGTLQFAKVAALYGGTVANWSKIDVKSGATLAVNVGGANEFTSANLDSLKALGTGSSGFESGAILGLDTTNATGGNFTYASNIANPNSGANVLGITKLGSNTLTLTGSNTYTGATTVAAGELQINGSLSASSAVSVESGATLSGSGTVGGSVTATSATLNGNGLHVGATTLYGASTVKGYNIASSVTVASGTTALTGTTKSTSTLIVSQGATLNANGMIDGSATVSGLLSGTSKITGNLALTSGTLSPGNSTGLTTVSGNFSMDAASKLVAEVSGTVAGTSYDQLKVSGNVALNGTLDLTSLSGLSIGETITLIDNAGGGTTTGYFTTILTSGSTYTLASNSDYTFTVNGTEYLLRYATNADGDGQYNDVTLTVVPEPATWAMLVGGVGLLTFGQRLRRRN